jgi:diadenosine tetraphosphate (Ap4A) HIT family hydrolase
MRFTLRSLKDEEAYQGSAKTPLADNPVLREFDHWLLIKNEYPYTMIMTKHDMLIPKRVVPTRNLLTSVELAELDQIIDLLAPDYDLMFENFPHIRSMPDHYHIHLARYITDRSDIKL